MAQRAEVRFPPLMKHSGALIRIVALALLGNVALSVFWLGGGTKFNGRYDHIPKVHSSALRSIIGEDGFGFYFALKDNYAGKLIVVPDNKTIDLVLVDRLTFIRPRIESYRMQLSPAEELKLQKSMQLSPAEERKLQKSGRAKSYTYRPWIRHPASVSTGRDESFIFIRDGGRSHRVFLMKGVLGVYFVPEEYLEGDGSSLP